MFPFNKGNGIQQYFCPKGSDHDGCALSINAADFEAVMTEAVIQWVCGPKFRERVNLRLAEVQGNPGQRDDLESMRSELADYRRLPERFQTQQTTARTAELETAVRLAEARLRAVPELALLRDVPTVERELRAAWERWSPEEKRARLRIVLDHVTINPGVRGHFDPGRIEPHWR
jgi:hypothetical protein